MYIVKRISKVKDGIRSEIREKIQKVKDHFNKGIEILIKTNKQILEMKESIN